jgi:S-methylmethionine-dependent homocysteine/selenocysteine methylase
MPTPYELIAAKLKAGKTVIIDGGTGTDIERRGAKMTTETWCADANRTFGPIITAVHADYIKSGAEIIAANTFATSMLSFNAYGRDDEVEELDALAISHAKAAAAKTGAAVAASFSTMRPVIAGSDRTDLSKNWTEAQAKALFRRKAQNFKALGVDLIMMEMMRDADYSLWACQTAKETGLPLWICISVERVDGTLVGFGRNDQKLAEFAPLLAALQPDVMCIMHTSPNDTDEALRVLRQSWKGPMGAYPECGYYKAPSWVFHDVIAPVDLVAKALDWHQLGATVFGGCCGIGPDHIKALSKEFHS